MPNIAFEHWNNFYMVFKNFVYPITWAKETNYVKFNGYKVHNQETGKKKRS